MTEKDISMHDIVERGILASLGILSLTREKAQSVVDELVKRGEVRRDDSKGLVDRLVQRGEEERGSFRKLIHEEVARVAHELNLATHSDLQALEKKIEALTQKPPAQ
jgi:polyhydroxyalkanoate synthesis regulator phasin